MRWQTVGEKPETLSAIGSPLKDVDELTKGISVDNGKVENITRLMIFMAATGMNAAMIARNLSLTSDTVRRQLDTPLAKQELEKIQNEIGRRIVKTRFAGLAIAAQSKVKSLMEGAKQEGIQLRAAQDILDRAMFSRNAQPEEETDTNIRSLIRRMNQLEKVEQERMERESNTIDVTSNQS